MRTFIPKNIIETEKDRMAFIGIWAEIKGSKFPYNVGEITLVSFMPNIEWDIFIGQRIYYETSNDTNLVMIGIEHKDININSWNGYGLIPIRGIASQRMDFPVILGKHILIKNHDEMIFKFADYSGSEKDYMVMLTIEGTEILTKKNKKDLKKVV